MLPFTSAPWLRLRAWAWRLRAPLTAVALALAVVLMLARLGPAPPATLPVLVTARALPAGATLGPGDVERRAVPLALVPDGLVAATSTWPTPGDDSAADSGARALTGRRLAVAVPAGLPLVPGLLTDPAAEPPAGSVVVPVRFADPALAALLLPGARVDVVAAPPVDGAPAERVAQDVLVLDAPGCAAADEAGDGADGSGGVGGSSAGGSGSVGGSGWASGSGWADGSGGVGTGSRTAGCVPRDGPVLLAVPPEQAVALSGAAASAVLSAVIVG